MTQQYFEDFVYENEHNLLKLYSILTDSVETPLKYEDFCRFVYKKTVNMF